jgi:hypothetical protein
MSTGVDNSVTGAKSERISIRQTGDNEGGFGYNVVGIHRITDTRNGFIALNSVSRRASG